MWSDGAANCILILAPNPPADQFDNNAENGAKWRNSRAFRLAGSTINLLVDGLMSDT